MDQASYEADRKLKLIVGITLSEMGGAQKVVYDIIRSLPESKYDITLVTSPGGDLIEWVSELNNRRTIPISIITLPKMKREISPVNDLKTLWILYKILLKGKYDIAHFHSSKMGILGRLAAWLARTPIIYFTVHGWGINEYQPLIIRKLLGLAEKIAGRLCTKVICVSKYDMNKGIENGWINKEKACVIYNGIDEHDPVCGKLRKELNILEDTQIIGTIARLSEQKDPLFTIKVANELKRKGYNFKLVIIGDGPLRESCEQLIDQLRLSDDVYLLGARNDARDLLDDFDIFTLFSKWEGLPLTVIEAMYAGKSVIASNVGGIPELIEHEQNGYLLKSFDTKEAVFYIEKLLVDNHIKRKMGKINEEKAKKEFMLSGMINNYKQIYSVDNK